MKKLSPTLILGLMLGFHFSAAYADPPMPPFYASVMKMAPEGKLGGNIQHVKLLGEQTHFSTPPTSEQFYLPWI
jgi:hypothetical protein